jgi:hypothetical protein
MMVAHSLGYRETFDERSKNQTYPANTIYEFSPLGEFFSAADIELGVNASTGNFSLSH